jgi:hypothetical protein
MSKRKAYEDLVETFVNGGGREPYWEEAMAWNLGYNAGFASTVNQVENGLQLDPESNFSPDNEILAKAFAELDEQNPRGSEDTTDES